MRAIIITVNVLLVLSTIARAELTHRYSFTSDAKDSVGKIDATLKGDAKITDGKLVLDNGTKTSEDPKLSYLEFGSSVLPKSGSVSLVVWIQAKENPLFSRVIDFGETQDGQGNAFIYLVAQHEESQSRAAITAGDTGAKTYLGGPKLDDDKPHMAALVIDGKAGKLQLFIDGKETAKAEDLGDNTLDKVHPVHCWLGRSSFDADPGLSGSISEFRVYDHALSASEITAINKAGPDALPASSQAPAAAPMIDVAHAPSPLFDDPVWHGATDPFVVWNPAKNQWFMYYTQRRATMPNPNGVDWVHGSAIGIATSPDGITWTYLGTAKGDHDLSDPLAARGAGPEPGVTWWAPCFLYENNAMHMWVTGVDGVYTNWTGKRNIMHFTSDDGMGFKYVSTAKLSSDRVIDPTVYKVGDTWYMVYKDEAAGSRTIRSQSTDMENWTNATRVSPDGSQEAPFAFQWRGKWWLIVDAVSSRGLRIYSSENGIDGWQFSTTILASRDGTRPRDNNVAHHPGIVLQGQGDTQQCLIYYFTHQGNQTVMQLAELELGADGKPTCNRNKYALATLP